MLFYDKIGNINRDIFDCCDKNPGTATPGGDCCYETWVKDLDQVTADWKQANADASNKETAYHLYLEELSRLNTWFNDWEMADEKADALCRQLELFVLHLGKICMVTKKTDEAIEILFCMTEDLYIRVDKLKADYDKLIQCIQCLKRPELGAGVGIMKFIESYGLKLDAVIQTRDILIAQIVTALELAYGMHINLCEEYGLKEVIHYWKKRFNCGGSCGCHSDQQTAQLTAVQGGYGKEHCHLEPHITMPIQEDPYFTGLETDYKNVKDQVNQLKKELDAAKEKRDALLACKQSLEKAIEQVNPANKTN